MSSTIGILTGPTASGKTALALELAERAGDVEIVNADSLSIFRSMDIGTAKPTPEERSRVPHHLIDIREPHENYTAGDFVREVEETIRAIQRRGRRPLLVGGTGFYLKALLYGLWEAPRAEPALRAEVEAIPSPELYRELFERDEQAALRIGGNDRYRLVRAIEILRATGLTPTQLEAQARKEPDPRFALWILDREAQELERRIEARAREMIRRGLVDECARIIDRYPDSRALLAVGYAQARAYLEGREPPGRKVAPGTEGLEREITLATRQLVKRQRTWFRGMRIGEWFTLDRDRAKLEAAFAAVYGPRGAAGT